MIRATIATIIARGIMIVGKAIISNGIVMKIETRITVDVSILSFAPARRTHRDRRPGVRC